MMLWRMGLNTIVLEKSVCKGASASNIGEFMPLFVPKIDHVGKQTYSAPDLYVANPKQTVIGSFTSIGNRVRIGHGTHPQSYLSTSPYLYLDRLGYKTAQTPSHDEWELLAPVHIGSDVWIGDDVFIKNGVTVGHGAIIGAKTVVTKDVPPYAIVCGNPARVLRYRFEAGIIEKLLKLKWWNLPNYQIKQLPYDNIYAAIDMIEQFRKK